MSKKICLALFVCISMVSVFIATVIALGNNESQDVNNLNHFELISESSFTVVFEGANTDSVGLIGGLTVSTKISSLINDFVNDTSKIQVFRRGADLNSEVLISSTRYSITNIGTGMTFKLLDTSGTVLQTLYAVLRGDITGDGLIDIFDVMSIEDHLDGFSPICNLPETSYLYKTFYYAMDIFQSKEEISNLAAIKLENYILKGTIAKIIPFIDFYWDKFILLDNSTCITLFDNEDTDTEGFVSIFHENTTISDVLACFRNNNVHIKVFTSSMFNSMTEVHSSQYDKMLIGTGMTIMVDNSSPMMDPQILYTILKGDASGDGRIDYHDVHSIIDSINYSPDYFKYFPKDSYGYRSYIYAMNLYLDSNINVLDVSMLIDYLVGSIPEFEHLAELYEI